MTEINRGIITFIHGDNMEFLRKIKEDMRRGYFHLGIVDPPYGISVGKMNLGGTKDTVRNYEMGDWDNQVPTQEYWNLLNYACRNLIVWGGNYFTDKMGQVEVYEKIKGIKPGRCFIVWDKMNDKMSFAHGELALTTFDKNAVILRRPRNKGGEDETEKRHPTQKPVYLYDYLHLNFVERGQRVLDTHGGSCNHAIAALKNNINLTIIEANKSYIDSALKAFDSASSAPRLLF